MKFFVFIGVLMFTAITLLVLSTSPFHVPAPAGKLKIKPEVVSATNTTLSPVHKELPQAAPVETAIAEIGPVVVSASFSPHFSASPRIGSVTNVISAVK